MFSLTKFIENTHHRFLTYYSHPSGGVATGNPARRG